MECKTYEVSKTVIFAIKNMMECSEATYMRTGYECRNRIYRFILIYHVTSSMYDIAGLPIDH